MSDEKDNKEKKTDKTENKEKNVDLEKITNQMSEMTKVVETMKTQQDLLLKENTTLKEQIDKKEEEKKEKEKKSLEGEGNFKELYQQSQKAIEELKLKEESRKQRETEEKKAEAIFEEVRKLGLKESYGDKIKRLINTKSVGIDNESGIVFGHENEAERIKTEFPDIFGEKKVIDNPIDKTKKDKTKTEGEKLTLEEWQKLPHNEKMKRRHELL